MKRPQQHLEYYECTLDDHRAFITADLDLHDRAPQKERPIVARFTILLRNPREDGLPIQEESSRIYELEDRLEEVLWNSCRAVLAGKVFSNGARKVYFYLASVEGLDAALQPIQGEFVPHELDWTTWEDPEWEVFLQMLYPNPLAFQYISDGKVLELLQREGDPLVQPRELLHWIYFKDEATALAFLQARETEGFARVGLERTEDDPARPWVLEISRVDAVDHGHIVRLTEKLWIAAEKLGGDYDGWECEAQTP